MPDSELPERPSSERWAFEKWCEAVVGTLIDKPVTLFREKVVEPIQGKNKYYYYHRKFRRVPNVDECPVGGQTCIYEANEQFKRDRRVDSEIVTLLMQRKLECETYYGMRMDADTHCQKERGDYKEASTNWFIKYGDLGGAGTVLDAYVKQKNRLLWERRHGPVGSGMKEKGAVA